MVRKLLVVTTMVSVLLLFGFVGVALAANPGTHGQPSQSCCCSNDSNRGVDTQVSWLARSGPQRRPSGLVSPLLSGCAQVLLRPGARHSWTRI